MGFSIAENPLRTVWMPVDYNNATAQTVYVGQFVVAGAAGSNSGIKPWVQAGAADTTTDNVPFGIVKGLNVYPGNGSYSSTYKAEYATSVRTQAAQQARTSVFQEGMARKNDPALWAQVEVIGPHSVIRGSICNAADGTAPTVATVTAVAGSGDGTGFTCGTTGFDFTAVAYNATYYCRSGNNAGLYRVGYDTNAGTGAKTFYGPNWPYTVQVGDTFVGVNTALGTCKLAFDLASVTAAGHYVNCAAALTSDYIWANVLEINLEEAGKEYVLFTLNPLQLLAVRA